ncbi:MAG: 2-amino-4-hydroxy-6-hydroxymethyldihydropteridine diphosphokinase [Candidatus Latescibacterota bacterium]|nr:MAG: 2-amino-4-hydroxy-6-hydroxymethyldihydropteridine diphosphokinase [Candidatus Latescibacterota bacterium]
MTTSFVVHLGLGSNVGERLQHLERGVLELRREGVHASRLSRVWVGAYVGTGPAQPEYLNAVVEAHTSLAPLDLLARTQSVEARCGRPPGTHLRPRTLDIDILFFGGWIIRNSRLVVPHPRLAARRFVLEPLHDVAGLENPAWPGLAAQLQLLRKQQPLQVYGALRLRPEDREASHA